ncbi:histidine phosphatase family protein [Lentilactobacillus otakiensis]|uniref:Phosphoglycerate mutase n=1 Tax=Lentilactobacillus otakiensis DSM 19908 = JCM 15040 TaxID=1423780 RepID=S4NNM1_9LACO|nr:histidine phosphatase family protein [Lentilactobacillus otakiensis]KRL08573.1 phosphoglycerate mutase [Lentilactobacillus otakiensis DSM 19908 = JCM 15040]MBZ3777645.1 histidine phosphatase family protein [Lentilactobacillus otakiensis]MDV3518676.1 histidine phosphatase family protein [Lentilactobacillus otakiensis]GAD17436.1 phosphoglycerate mutase [Lentilactobacillus otakiensis DSM 19908 = JCM 15040]
MTKLYFVRHGKTEWNLESRYQGAGGDSPLLPQSYDEMDLLGKHFQKVPFAHIYASPIKRARVTAARINRKLKKHPKVSLLSRLEEFHLGKMEGQKFADVEQQYPEEFEDFRNHPDLYDPKAIGGESYQEVIDRMTPAITAIVKAYPDDNIMIVSHGAALNAEMNALLGVPLADLRKRGGLANTSTTILESNDGGQSYQLIDWNDTSYLNRKIDPTDLV